MSPETPGITATWIRLALPVLLAASIAASANASESITDSIQTDARPNILVLMAEDLSARIGAFGDPLARTPNIDRLAARGVRFPNTFTAAGVCAPSRAAFITGVHQISLGAQHMRTSSSPVANYLAVPAPQVKAFPELLRQAGYHTFTDRKLDYQFSGIGAGTGPASIWDAEGNLDHLANLPDDRPFFGLLNFLITHESAAFLPDSVTSAAGLRTAEAALNARSSLPQRTSPEAVEVPPYYPDLPEVRAHIADLYDNVQLMDTQVGEILSQLERAGRLANTIIIWTTDHGDLLPRAKRELFDSGIQVPMVITWPDNRQPSQFQPGAMDSRLISFVDLAPIILSMAGLNSPAYLQGRNLFDSKATPRRYIYASRDRIDQQPDRVRAVRDQRFKYLRYFDPGTPGAVHLPYRDQGRIMQALWEERAAGRLNPVQALWFEPRPEEALYDLNHDPFEVRNLAADPDYLGDLSRLRSAYGAWRVRVPDHSDVPESELAERFWPGGKQPTTVAPIIELTGEGAVELRAEQGASIEFRIVQGSNPGVWRVYQQPLQVQPGSIVHARAVRYGYALSTEVSLAVVTP